MTARPDLLRFPGTGALALATLLYLYLPIVIVVVLSFNAGPMITITLFMGLTASKTFA